MGLNNKSLKTTGLLRLKIKIKIFLAVFSLLTVSVSLYTSAINKNPDHPFFMINNDIDNNCSLAEFESQNEGIMQNHPPETPDKPLGPTFIEAGVQYTYCAFTHDPDDDLIRYRFDWGDGSISNWTHWETSNIPVSKSHVWTSISTFNVKVIAQDEKGLNSSWSPAPVATVSQADPIELPSFVDTSMDKFIRNSDGNCWEATSANIQVAIDDLIYGGTVFLPSDITFNIVNDIGLRSNVCLKGNGVTTVLNMVGGELYIEDKNNVTLSDFRITGNRSIYALAWGSNSTGLLIENIEATVKNPTRIGTFFIFVSDGYIYDDIRFSNCRAIDCSNFGWFFTGSVEGNDEITNVYLENCKSINCGRYEYYNNWTCGFNLAENTNIINLTVINCIATGNWESGFHMEFFAIKENILFVNCTSNNNGQKTCSQLGNYGVATYGAGFVVDNSILNRCCMENNRYGIYAFQNCIISNSYIHNNAVQDVLNVFVK